jgi:polar amino acid transport system substrate-binding protein
MYEDRSTPRTRRLIAVVATILLVFALVPAAALGTNPPQAEVSFVPITGTIDELDIEFEVPEGDFEVPVALVLEFPAEMRPESLRGTGVRFSTEGDVVRSPAISSDESGVTLTFTASVPPPGTVFAIKVVGLDTPDEGGSFPVPVFYGEADSLEQVGEFEIEVPDANFFQGIFRAMEEVPFLRQFFSPTIIWNSLPLLWQGFQVAVLILFVSYSVGIPLGLMVSFMKMSRIPIVRIPATIYVDVVRGTPLLVQLLLVYFGITFLPFWTPLMNALGPLAELAAVQHRCDAVLSRDPGAVTELVRVHGRDIPCRHPVDPQGPARGGPLARHDVAQSMAYVIIPQTVRRILPTMMSEFILLFKDTSILFAVGIFELTLQARTIQAATFNMSPYIAAAGFYLMLTVPLGRFVANSSSGYPSPRPAVAARNAASRRAACSRVSPSPKVPCRRGRWASDDAGTRNDGEHPGSPQELRRARGPQGCRSRDLQRARWWSSSARPGRASRRCSGA